MSAFRSKCIANESQLLDTTQMSQTLLEKYKEEISDLKKRLLIYQSHADTLQATINEANIQQGEWNPLSCYGYRKEEYEIQKPKLVALLGEGVTGSTLEQQMNAVIQYAERLKRLVEGEGIEWRYPSNGELPKDEQDVWLLLPQATGPFLAIHYDDDGVSRFMSKERKHTYTIDKVWCWSLLPIPNPPVTNLNL